MKGDKNKKKFVVNLNLSNKGEYKKTIEFNVSNNTDKKKESMINTSNDSKGKDGKGKDGKGKDSKGNILKDGFFGWDNIKWLIVELIKIYSPKPSYFSKKRIESSIGFIIAQWGMILYLYNNLETLSMSDFLLWASAEFVIAGYYMNQIQKEKKDLDYESNIHTYEINDDDYVGDDNDGYQDPNIKK